MKYSLIIQHLKGCGYSVSTAKVLDQETIEVSVSIDKFEVTLIHIKVNELTSMPSFLLKTPQKFPKLAHTLWSKDKNLATICVNVPDSVSINFEVPELVFEDSLKKHIELLTKCLSNSKWNKEELLREFLTSWNNINDVKYHHLICIPKSKDFQKMSIHSAKGKYGLAANPLAYPESLDTDKLTFFFTKSDKWEE